MRIKLPEHALGIQRPAGGLFMRFAVGAALLLGIANAFGGTIATAAPAAGMAMPMSAHAQHVDTRDSAMHELDCATACQQAQTTAPQPTAIHDIIRKKIKQPKPELESRPDQPLAPPAVQAANTTRPFVTEIFMYTCAYLS